MSLLAVDCDEMLIESIRGLSEYASEKYGYDRPYEQFRDYFITNNPHIHLTKEESIRLFDEYFTSSHARLAKPVDGAREVLQGVKNQGHILVVVTGRNALAKVLTYDQMDMHYAGIFRDIILCDHYTGNHMHKVDVCKKIHAEALFEDLIDTAIDVSSQGIPTYLLKKPWNAYRTETHPLIHKVNHWSEIHLPPEGFSLAK